MTPSPSQTPAPPKRPAPPKARKPPRLRKVRAWLSKGHDPLASLYLTIPVFLTYHLGILGMHRLNGADFVSRAVFEVLEYSKGAYVALTLGIAAGLVLAVRVLRRTSTLRTSQWLPMLGESLVLAVVVPLIAGWTTKELFDLMLGIGSMTPFEKVVMAAGAGFHEELLFRVGLFGGLTWLLTRVGNAPVARAALVSAVLSSIAFSGVHYVGALGDDFMLMSFTFRALGGLLLCAVYWWRGFAVAVYTHMFYDLFVFFLK
ncbi:MAG: CPBP family glutamic-type intramembrane protease [Nannocystaceae bacterium]